MATWHEVYQSYLNLSFNELANIGANQTSILVNELERKYGTDAGMGYYFDICGTFFCADKVINYEEHELFCKITGISVSYDEFFNIFKGYTSSEEVRKADYIIDNLSQNGKNAAIALGLVFCAANETITVAEQELIEKYFN